MFAWVDVAHRGLDVIVSGHVLQRERIGILPGLGQKGVPQSMHDIVRDPQAELALRRTGELFGIEKGGKRSKDRKTRSLNECREAGQPDMSTINARFEVSVARKNPVSATVES
jgi:hypothetical protein